MLDGREFSTSYQRTLVLPILGDRSRPRKQLTSETRLRPIRTNGGAIPATKRRRFLPMMVKVDPRLHSQARYPTVLHCLRLV
jgi:hypothetical protein